MDCAMWARRPPERRWSLSLTYQVQVTRWFMLQPDLQFIINPGGTNDFANAVVIGGRAAIVF